SRAQDAAPEPLGYVVRLVDPAAVVLDLGEKTGAAPGRPFVIFKEGEELKHPVSGQSLGRMEVKVAQGEITEVAPLYSVGALASPEAARTVAPGMRARLLAPKPAAAAASPKPQDDSAPVREPRWRGPAFDYRASAMVVADCGGDGQLRAALSDGRSVFIYPYPPRDDKPAASFTAKETGLRIMSLDAGDLNGNGRAELFASVYNQGFARLETIVLELDAQGNLARVADLPFLVRGYQDQAGRGLLASQQVTEDRSFPFGAVYPLVWNEGKYRQGRPALAFPKRRVDWLYDFTFASFDGKAAAVSVGSTELVRVQFTKGGAVKTPDSYGQTPNRVRWTGDRMLHFRPPMLARAGGKSASLYLVKNIAGLGGLAGPFGVFSRGELARMDWNGLSLSPAWRGALGGYCVGLSLVSAPGGPELAAAVVGAADTTSLWAFDP
ncbi:MAG: hypothetical protein PHF00_13715, partial [Elusimicrobia bacterium]|nr:hypothetical protein [Elusimicrobiota bacterium]